MRKNQPRIGANPALRAPRIGFALPHSRSLGLIDPTARPFIGTVRANPVAAPAAPLRGILDFFIFQIFFIGIDKSFPLKFTPLTKIE